MTSLFHFRLVPESNTQSFGNSNESFLLFARSLCYQFPAVYKEDGLSLVISPLLALIQDQVQALNDKQIIARTLNSTISQQEKKLVLGDLMQKQPTTRLLYITPELAATQSFLSIIKRVHQRKLINYLIIDEGISIRLRISIVSCTAFF